MNNEERLGMLCEIIETFEDLLEEYGIEIPNPEKQERDDPDCASNIYGSDYGFLEERITQILTDYHLLEDE